VSLIIEDRLWGMLACHHRTPRQASARVRAASEQGAVNLSACQLAYPGLVDAVLAQLEAAGIAPSRLCIEVTETQIMEHPEQAGAVLTELAAAGITIAIDDFGVGFSSLAYARNLPARILKIDRSFVGGLPDNPRDLAVVSSTVRLAHDLGMRTVGEGVETHAQLACLRELGCDSVQGYLLGRPIPAGPTLDGFLTHGASAGEYSFRT